ncbi:hypothetical protein ACFOEK_14065 [Litoribrevibacter euphylliae]|uniref:DUF4169 family protein n=1 Tax=Litoribrevibacter euphylliae TaxID=1834034 RepID=A0ABV7HHB1_9GAMM
MSQLKASKRSERISKARLLVARFSRGNVNLQRGAYVTEQQLQERKKSVLAHSFT